ncbi:L-fucose:H+ symporter permease-like protein [Hyaloscypha bicolor E]|uniref:L-fucose:H+ symporter permease-like protein n=1 Tax=Hyaloscypha bicolor E TaxID=1095630 RepID=A0A2J6TRP3_9HELO|nr:L-fucose:H+ symporter permease-like protein [Hyaloscypha bicolor E]PMD65701.1 L-fucose:H+ symporter permease-like protein [Hyaloscypha bicolor E]
MAGGAMISTGGTVEGGFLTGRALYYPVFLITLLFFLWGFSYGLLDVLNSHFQTVLSITKLQSTGLQVMYFGGGYFFFSPIAAEVLKRRGYKTTILMGLALYSLGAVFFWPVAHFSTPQNKLASYGGFLVCTFVIACGLSTLETSANSYAVIIGDPASASIRLQFCQSWNGVASFVGPLIASKFFFTGSNAHNLTNVQYVYLAVACLGVAVAVLFIFTRLPEVSEQTLADNANIEITAVDEEGNQIGQASLWKQYNMFFAFGAQFAYVGAQVTIGAFFINYVVENGGYDKPTASNFLSYALIIFTVGRFVAVCIAFFLAPSFIMCVYSALAIAFTAASSAVKGSGGVGVLMATYFLMAPMYPTIFTLGTANLGTHTRRGAGILVMGVAGGAVFPPIQGAVADSASTRISMVIPLVGFVYVFGYCLFHWFTHGRNFRRVKDIVVAADTAGRKGSAWGGALGGAINYVHYTGEKESLSAQGGRRASIISHGRRSSVAVHVKRASVSHGEVIEEEQKGNPILL